MSSSPSSHPPVADTDIFLVGMRRSGIHGVVSWLLPHLEGVTRLINDPPFTAGQGHGPLAGQPVRYYHARAGRTCELLMQHEIADEIENTIKETTRLYLESCPRWFSWVAKSVMRKYRRHRSVNYSRAVDFPFDGTDLPRGVNTNLFVLENITPREFADIYPRWQAGDYTEHLARFGLAPSRRSVILLLLRDPWNQLASVIKLRPMEPPRPVAPEDFRATWLGYAEELAGHTRFLPPCGEVIPVLYSRWFKDADYRRLLAERLGVPATDAGLHIVANFGGGSSFDGRNMSGQAQGMKVEERWKAYADHPLMRELCADPRVRTLARETIGLEAPELPPAP